MASNRGMTLLEVMMAVAIFTLVMGVLFGLSISFSDAAGVQQAETVSNEEARRALQRLVPMVRSGAEGSFNWGNLPGHTLTFQPADDTDGNGTAVDVQGDLELGEEVTVQPDFDDENGDGVTDRQLVLLRGDDVIVLANNLTPESGVVDAQGVPAIRGFWVEARDGGVDITIQTESTNRSRRPFRTALTEFVVPRN